MREAQRLPPLIVIAGPTATGKTALSIALAQGLAGDGIPAEIISADSRQVYRGMDVGTAKVEAASRALIPHHGLDLADPDERFTAADFQRHAHDALAGIAARGGVALLVGGTGLYLRVVARGFVFEPTTTHSGLRSALEQRLAVEGLGALVADLTARAPALAASVDRTNPRRVVRALERALLTGGTPPPPPRGYPAPVLWIGISLDASEHRARIEARVRQQFETGLVEEA